MESYYNSLLWRGVSRGDALRQVQRQLHDKTLKRNVQVRGTSCAAGGGRRLHWQRASALPGAGVITVGEG